MRHEIGFRGLRLTRASEDDGRTVEGIAVPFGDVIDVWGQRETFDPDTVFDGLDTAKLYYQHNQLIGSITHGENQPDGLHITARIADSLDATPWPCLTRALSTPCLWDSCPSRTQRTRPASSTAAASGCSRPAS